MILQTVVIRKRWSNSAAVGFSGTGAGNLSEDRPLKGNENGSLFGTLDAEITHETTDFFVSDAEGDPDCPSEGYTSVEQALNTLRNGKVRSSSNLETGSIFCLMKFRRKMKSFVDPFLILTIIALFS